MKLDPNKPPAPQLNWGVNTGRFQPPGQDIRAIYMGKNASLIMKAFGRPTDAKAVGSNGVWTYPGMKIRDAQGKTYNAVRFTIQPTSQGDGKVIAVEVIPGAIPAEAAVALALEWLKSNQSKDGRWNHRTGHSTAATGAAMLAFLGWGAKHTEPGPYQQTLARAIDWMLSVEKNGDLRYRGNMYDHGIAAIALMEAYNLTKDERLRAPAERVLAFTLKAQNPQSGGWRYKPHREDPSEKGDLSVTGWQMMILKSARLGGMKVPEDSFAKARKFLDGVAVDGKGFQYRPGWTPSSAMIAEGLFCEQMLGAGVTTPKMEQCLNLIQKQLPSKNRVDYYYWYYGSLAMRQAQGQDWQSWNNKLKPILLRKQILRGNNRGAWAPEGKDSKAAGRVVTTALAALSLEVYYRYLPLYSPEFSKAGN